MSLVSEEQLNEAARKEEEEAIRRMLSQNAGSSRQHTSFVEDVDTSTFEDKGFSAPENKKYKYILGGIILFLVIIISAAFFFRNNYIPYEKRSAGEQKQIIID